MVTNLRSLGTATPSALYGFFAATILTFGLLCLAGRLSTTRNQFEHFQRFHLYINPQTLFYPTASQVVMLAKDTIPKDRIGVIIGGSSVVWGAGQTEADLWSRHLQEILGDRYSVINLAFPSGSPPEHGAIAAQALLSQGYKVIFVSDLGHSFGPPDGLFYKYVYWDAYYKGLIPPYQPLLVRVEEIAKPYPQWREDLADLQFRSRLDSWFYFTDLWNTIGYTTVFTTWNYLVYPPAGYLTTARKRFPDPHSEIPREQRHTNPPVETAMEMVRGVSPLVCPDEAEPAKSMVRIEAFWREFENDALASFPETFRQHMILSRVYQSRLYVGQLSEHDFQCYKALYDTSVAKLRSYGYGAATFGENWTADDYVDVTHPSPEGSKKLAAELAPMIRQLAQQLGYLE